MYGGNKASWQNAMKSAGAFLYARIKWSYCVLMRVDLRLQR